MMTIMAKIITIICGMVASNRYFAYQYQLLSEELALEQMTNVSAQAMEQIARYQNLMMITPVMILLCGAIWLKPQFWDLLDDLSDHK